MLGDEKLWEIKALKSSHLCFGTWRMFKARAACVLGGDLGRPRVLSFGSLCAEGRAEAGTQTADLGAEGFQTHRDVKLLSCVQIFAIPWTVAYQAPLSMEFSRREYWSGLLFPSPGDLPEPGNTEPTREDWDLLLLLLNLFMYLRKFCQTPS